MRDSISKTLQKINIKFSFSSFLAIVISLLVLNVFLAIRLFLTLSIIKDNKNNILYIVNKENLTSDPEVNMNHFIYASKKGKKYYFYNCKANIKEENKIYFSSETEAESFGYSLSKSCQ